MSNSTRAAALIVITVAFSLTAIHGQDAAPRRRVRAVGGALVPKAGEGADDSKFARWAFGKAWDVESARSRLDSLLKRKIEAIDSACELTDAQRQKLELAGRGDVRKLFDGIEEIRSEFESAGNEFEMLQKLYQHWQPLKGRLTAGLFGGDSLFAKTLAAALTDAQKEKYDQRGSRAGIQAISVKNCVAMVPISTLPKDVYQIVWRRDGQQAAFVATTFDRPVEIFQLPDFKVVGTVGEGRKPVGFDFSPDENIVAITDNSQTAIIVNIGTGQEIALQTANQQPAVSFSPDGKWLATGGYGTDIQLWETASGKLVKDFSTGNEEGGLRAVFSPDGTKMAVGNRNSTTCLFDVASGRLIHRLGKRMSQGLQFDPTGKVLAVAYVDATLVLWDVATGNQIRSVKAQAEELYSVDWSPDGTLLLTSGNQGQVTIWDPSDLSLLVELESPDWVITARFTPDGKKVLFSGGGNVPQSVRQVEIWGVP